MNAKLNELKRRFNSVEMFTISSLNTQKRHKLSTRYSVKEQVKWIAFDDLPTFGNRPSLFQWDEGNEDSHATRYTNYIRNDFLDADYLNGYEVKDVHANEHYWKTQFLQGTTDVVVFEQIGALMEQDVTILAFELKKEIVGNDENQAIGELLAANLMSSKRPVVLLTDLYNSHYFFWLGQTESTHTVTVHGTSFMEIHKAATFARLILVPNKLLRRNAASKIGDWSDDLAYDDDIGNLDDFEDEMGPEERASWVMTKKLRKWLPLVPPRFRYCDPTRDPPLPPIGMYS
ncbi:906_t:CDS:2 [Paraglomus brasilianum]|uniref:906_t:CDS:1 n=1 Tax=Paraglomus brasilianum TaxID=144538 RepID=A0A9N9H0H7_9GLOM|nr:906_t:CDS:2 [Paraglomus brasilianum]